MAQRANVVVARLDDVCDVVLEGECAVEGDAEDLQAVGHIDRTASDDNRWWDVCFFQRLIGAEKSHV